MAGDAELRAARRAVEEDPAGVVVHYAVVLSTEPTVVDGRLAERHVDLRPFVLVGGDGPGSAEVLPAALSRVALTEGDLVVSCSQGGGGKDVWVPAAPAPTASPTCGG